MMRKLLFSLLVFLTSVGAQAWVSETPVEGGQYYLYNVGAGSFITINANGVPENTTTPLLFTLTEGPTTGTDLAYTIDGTTYYLYQSAGTYGYCQDNNKDVQSGRSTATMKSYGDGYRWKIKSYSTGYQIYSNHKYESYLDWFTTKYRHNTDNDRYMNYTGTVYNCTKQAGEYNTAYATWLFVSEDQYKFRTGIDFSGAIDVTAFTMVNPGAEANNTGWTGDVTALPSAIAHSGSHVFETAGWWAFDLKSISQTVTELPNGYYNLSAWRMAGTSTTCTLSGNDISASSLGTGDQGDAKWQQLSVITQVTDGTLQIEASSKSDADGSGESFKTTWANFDDFTLTYLGDTKVNLQVSGTAQYGTFCAPFDVTLPSGVKAYSAAKGSGSWIQLTELSTSVSAGTPVVLAQEGDAAVAQDYYGNYAEDADNDGILKGVYTKTAVTPNAGNYLLQYKNGAAGFYLVTESGRNIGANRCYLHVDNGGARISLGEEETAIESLQTEAQGKKDGKYLVGNRVVVVKNGKAYSLNGQIVK